MTAEQILREAYALRDSKDAILSYTEFVLERGQGILDEVGRRARTGEPQIWETKEGGSKP